MTLLFITNSLFSTSFISLQWFLDYHLVLYKATYPFENIPISHFHYRPLTNPHHVFDCVQNTLHIDNHSSRKNYQNHVFPHLPNFLCKCFLLFCTKFCHQTNSMFPTHFVGHLPIDPHIFSFNWTNSLYHNHTSCHFSIILRISFLKNISSFPFHDENHVEIILRTRYPK